MHTIKKYTNTAKRRALRIRGQILGSGRPRLAVHKSNKYIFAQIINPDGSAKFGIRGKNPAEVGKEIAQKATKGGVEAVVFDRGSYRYHGQVKALADAAREGGLKF